MDLWKEQLVASLKVGHPEPKLAEHIEEILAWIRSIQADETDELSDLLSKDFEKSSVLARFEDLLDRLYLAGIHDDIQLFPSDLHPEKARFRYRKMISIFHPDKGQNSSDWLTFRAEKINSLYQTYKRQISRPRSLADNLDSKSKPSGSRSTRSRSKRSHRSSQSQMSFSSSGRARNKVNWRTKFGDPANIEDKLLASMKYGVVILLVFVVVIWLGIDNG